MSRFPLSDLGLETVLRCGSAELGVTAALGARLTRWSIAGTDILRPLTDHGKRRGFAYGFAGFPLLPYSGPIFGGGFRHDGRFHALSRNVSQEPDATHGEGWLLPWTIREVSGDRLDLTAEWEPKENAFPFRWSADISYRLAERALLVEMRLTNRDWREMPAGMGFHPYFCRGTGSVLRFEHTGLWPYDAPEKVTEGAGAIRPGLDFREGEDVSAMAFDRCFEGWDGLAVMETPGIGSVTIRASEIFAKLQCFAPFDDPYVCIEPVSNANDGFNRASAGVSGHGVVCLPPGHSLSGQIAIEVAP